MTKKLRKRTVGLFGATLLVAGGSLALGGIGNTVALRGQRGLQNAFAFAPVVGTLAGATALIRQVQRTGKKRVKKKANNVRRRRKRDPDRGSTDPLKLGLA